MQYEMLMLAPTADLVYSLRHLVPYHVFLDLEILFADFN